jgi:putative transposase
LNDAILDSSWARLIAMVSYNVEDAGRRIIAVNPRPTRLWRSDCGHISTQSRDREKFAYVSCEHSEHADINAARDVLRAGLSQAKTGIT